MKHQTTSRFWEGYHALPREVQRQADRDYALLCSNPRHPSLHFKKVGEFWSVRVGLHYRAVGIEEGNVMLWSWIGPHAEYERILTSRG